MKDCYLTPIQVDAPPCHSKIKVRCFTCKKFPVCNIREDYLKTAILIEEVLGNPQEDFELKKLDCCGDCYDGIIIDNTDNYFPDTIYTNKHDKGLFVDAKCQGLDVIMCQYKINNYLVIFTFKWDTKENSYEYVKGQELYYRLPYTLSDDDIATISVGLQAWRQTQKEQQEDKDIINTTYFSSILNCDFYDWDKNLTEQEGVNRIYLQYPDGIPCKCGIYHHLATYHIEPYKIPINKFAPHPYPKLKECKEVLTRRDDIDGI